MVIGHVAGRPTPEPYSAALAYQQRNHVEKSVDYAKKTLDLGVKRRS